MPKPLNSQERARLDYLEKEQAAKVPYDFAQAQMAGKSMNQVDSLEMEVSKLRSMVEERDAELLGLYRRLHGLDRPNNY